MNEKSTFYFKNGDFHLKIPSDLNNDIKNHILESWGKKREEKLDTSRTLVQEAVVKGIYVKSSISLKKLFPWDFILFFEFIDKTEIRVIGCSSQDTIIDKYSEIKDDNLIITIPLPHLNYTDYGAIPKPHISELMEEITFEQINSIRKHSDFEDQHIQSLVIGRIQALSMVKSFERTKDKVLMLNKLRESPVFFTTARSGYCCNHCLSFWATFHLVINRNSSKVIISWWLSSEEQLFGIYRTFFLYDRKTCDYFISSSTSVIYQNVYWKYKKQSHSNALARNLYSIHFRWASEALNHTDCILNNGFIDMESVKLIELTFPRIIAERLSTIIKSDNMNINEKHIPLSDKTLCWIDETFRGLEKPIFKFRKPDLNISDIEDCHKARVFPPCVSFVLTAVETNSRTKFPYRKGTVKIMHDMGFEDSKILKYSEDHMKTYTNQETQLRLRQIIGFLNPPSRNTSESRGLGRKCENLINGKDLNVSGDFTYCCPFKYMSNEVLIKNIKREYGVDFSETLESENNYPTTSCTQLLQSIKKSPIIKEINHPSMFFNILNSK